MKNLDKRYAYAYTYTYAHICFDIYHVTFSIDFCKTWTYGQVVMYLFRLAIVTTFWSPLDRTVLTMFGYVVLTLLGRCCFNFQSERRVASRHTVDTGTAFYIRVQTDPTGDVVKWNPLTIIYVSSVFYVFCDPQNNAVRKTNFLRRIFFWRRNPIFRPKLRVKCLLVGRLVIYSIASRNCLSGCKLHWREQILNWKINFIIFFIKIMFMYVRSKYYWTLFLRSKMSKWD